MKVCKKCGKEKQLSYFYKNKDNKKDGLSSYCNECHKLNKKQHYNNNKKQYIKNHLNYKKWFVDLKKMLKCTRCGFSHPAALDFHHLDPTQKKFGIGRNVIGKKGITKEMILEEIEKCEVLCANCHRIEHAIYYEKN